MFNTEKWVLGEAESMNDTYSEPDYKQTPIDALPLIIENLEAGEYDEELGSRRKVIACLAYSIKWLAMLKTQG